MIYPPKSEIENLVFFSYQYTTVFAKVIETTLLNTQVPYIKTFQDIIYFSIITLAVFFYITFAFLILQFMNVLGSFIYR